MPTSGKADSGEILRLDAEALAGGAQAQLRAARIFSDSHGDGGVGPGAVARVRLEIALEDVTVAMKGAARAAIHLRIDTRPAGVAAPHWNEDVQAGSETLYDVILKGPKKTDKNVLFQKLVTRTVRDLLAAYVARQRLWAATARELHAATSVDAAEMRIEAIRVIGDRPELDKASTQMRL
jgi:hypothetical protein